MIDCLHGFRRMLVGLLLVAGGGLVQGAGFRDAFAERELATGNAFVVTGHNGGAGVEPGEPRIAGKRGGHSLWLSWEAPAHGVVTLTTDRSAVDTLLGAYTLEPGDDPGFPRLRQVEVDDDDHRDHRSRLQFTARAGTRYEFALDGYAGATGELALELAFQPAAAVLPSIVRRPPDASFRDQSALVLTLDIQAEGEFELRWYFNDRALDDAESRELIIPRFGPAHVGWYRAVVHAEDLTFSTPSIEVQLSRTGEPAVLAHDKPVDAADSLLPGPGNPRRQAGLGTPGAGVMRGYNGSQVFNTVYATADPGEPLPCGRAGGASYWFAYQAPEAGTLHLDTEGSRFDTLLAVYTYQSPLLDYSGLIPVTCDDHGATAGLPSRLEVPVAVGEHYVIQLDGVDGARGVACLNYRLAPAAGPTPRPPVFTRTPPATLAAAGATIQLDAVVFGDPPLTYQWFKNAVALPGETNATLTLSSVQPGDSGDYTLQVTNPTGATQSPTAALTVLDRPVIRFEPAAATTILSFPAQRGFLYTVESAADPQASLWTLALTSLTDAQGIVQWTNSVLAQPARYYRMRAR